MIMRYVGMFLGLVAASVLGVCHASPVQGSVHRVQRHTLNKKMILAPDEDGLMPWGQIVHSAEQCYKLLGPFAFTHLQEPSCGAIWDQVLCWPAAPARETVYQACPPLPGLDTTKYARRSCGIDGRWLGKGEVDVYTQKGWTNYIPCYTPYARALHEKLYGPLD